MQENSPLIFNCAAIKENGGLSVKLSPAAAAYDDAFDRPGALKKISLELNFSVGGDSILLAGKVEADLELECSRCGDLTTGSFQDAFDEVYPDTVECIDARETVREAVVLLAPMKVLCSESCKGRCPVCGVNRNRQACVCRPEASGPFSALKDIRVLKQDKQEKKKKL